MIGENQHQEIIIIKRGGEGEEGHHGGAWKIAFADFMTAMMALFLVLWLVNAANEETKKAVASYFNPVKLVDRNQSRKGLDEQTGGPSQGEEKGSSAATPTDKPAEAEAGKVKTEMEGAFFQDPFTSLEEIADAEMKKQAAGRQGGGNNNSKIEGEADPFPDPFDPEPVVTATESINAAAPAGEKSEKEPEAKTEPAAESAKPAVMTEALDALAIVPEAPETIEPSPEKTASTPTVHVKEAERSQSEVAAEDVAEDAGKKAAQRKQERAEKIEALSKEILEDIKAEIALVFDDAKAMNSALSVKAVEDGVLISVTDVLDYPMFEIGSAVPRGQIVLAMEKIGQVLAKQSGPLRIYGHTDARQYKAGSGDNWQLSSQRALAAYYMLGRAGLNAQRVTQVTGFADRELRETANPNADVNRRIELLLEVK
jgi:chemotaxis protein MotB